MIVKSFRCTILMGEEIEECVEKYGFENETSYIHFAITSGKKFLEKADFFKDNPDEATKFLEEMKPQIGKLKEQSAVLTYIQNLPEDMQNGIFHSLDEARIRKAGDELIIQRWKRYAEPRGFEIEKKIGYKEIKVELGNNTRTLFRPILPLDKEWETMTQNQRDALYLELKKKSEGLQERNDSSQMIDEKLRMIEKEMDFD